MICLACRLAADGLPKEGEISEEARDLARRMHQRCKGRGQCDCQHKLPEEKA